MLQDEILAPGTAVRRRAHEEVPLVDPANCDLFNEILENRSMAEPAPSSRRLELWGTCQRTVFVYAKGDDALAINLSEVLQGLGGEYDMEWCIKQFEGGLWSRKVRNS